MTRGRREHFSSIEQLCGLFERLGYGAFFWSRDLRLIACNGLAGRFYGINDDEVLRPGASYWDMIAAMPPGRVARERPGRTWLPLHPPDLHATVRRDFVNGNVFEMRFDGPPPRALIGSRATLRGGVFVTVTTDITERQQMAEALAREKSYLETMLETVDEGVALLDEHQHVVAYNPRMLALNGIDPEAVRPGDPQMKFLTSFGFMQAIPEEEREAVARRMIEDVSRTEPGTSHAVRALPSGRTLAVSRTLLPDGRSVVATQDITQAATVARERERLSAIVENIREGVMLLDGEERVLAFNRRSLDYFHIPHDAVRVGDHATQVGAAERDLDLLPPEERERRRAERLAFGYSWRDGAATQRRPLGDGRVLDVARIPIGESVLFTYHDVTAEEERSVLLERARREAVEASRLKSEFLARMSHELRTPMQGVLGMAAVLERTELGSEQRRALAVIQASGQHLLQLIEDLLALSALDAEGLALHPTPMPLSRPLGEAVEIVRPQAEERGLYLRFDPSPLDRVVVSVDATRLRQILINLLGNAVRYTRTGGVILSAIARPVESGAHHAVEIGVADTGRGVPQGMEEAIFQRFRQLAPAEDAVSQGIGMGLPTARGLARLMGGDVTVESPPGGGAVFTLRLELPRSEED